SGRLLPHLFTLTNSASIARRLAGFACAMPPCCAPPAVYFSVALSVASLCGEAPWRYQARCPVKSSGQQIVGHASGRCPDFPPAAAPCGPAASDYPARPLWLVYLANTIWNPCARKAEMLSNASVGDR